MYDDGDTSDFTLTLHSDHVDGASSGDYVNDDNAYAEQYVYDNVDADAEQYMLVIAFAAAADLSPLSLTALAPLLSLMMRSLFIFSYH